MTHQNNLVSKGKVQSLLEENKSLRMASVSIQVRAEQEEEYISNTLLKRIEVSNYSSFSTVITGHFLIID